MVSVDPYGLFLKFSTRVLCCLRTFFILFQYKVCFSFQFGVSMSERRGVQLEWCGRRDLNPGLQAWKAYTIKRLCPNQTRPRPPPELYHDRNGLVADISITGSETALYFYRFNDLSMSIVVFFFSSLKGYLINVELFLLSQRAWFLSHLLSLLLQRVLRLSVSGGL